jgi:hypothetical protein
VEHKEEGKNLEPRLRGNGIFMKIKISFTEEPGGAENSKVVLVDYTIACW